MLDAPEGEVDMTGFTAAITAPGTSTHLFKVGNGETWSDMLTLTLVVCGEETIQSSDLPRALNFVYASGSRQVSSIPTSELATFFTVGGDFASYCGPSKFEIVKATNAEASEF
jgi:hypothetical protein